MVTDKLAEFLTAVRLEDLPLKTIESSKRCFLDWLGSAFAGSKAEPTNILLEVVNEMGGEPQATIIANGNRSSCLWAGMVNSASSHWAEMDDVDKRSIFHPAAPIIPAALALAEYTGADGKQLIKAIVLGYEASIRIGEAISPSHYYFWHTTATVGTFGAAVACGSLLNLNKQQMIWALGSAGTQAAGLWEFLVDGAMSKQLHPAKAAYNGMLSALLARGGFTGATRILEGDKGFCRATASELKLDKISEGLSPGMTKYKIDNISFKVHASCRHTHSAMDAALAIVKEHNILPAEIEEVKTRIYSVGYDLLHRVQPDNFLAARFSMPYCVSLILKFQDAGVDKFSDKYLSDTDLKRLMGKIKLEADKGLDVDYPDKWPSVVEIRKRDGSKYEKRVDYPRGEPENGLSNQELVQKFRDLTSGFLSENKAVEYVDKSFKLEAVDNIANFFK